MKIIQRYLIFFIFLGCLWSTFDAKAQGQDKRQVIGFDSILNQLISSPDTLLVYRNADIDLGNYTLRKIDRLFSDANIDAGSLILNNSLEFYNCTIRGKGLSDLKMKRVVFQDCDISTMSLSNLHIDKFNIISSNLNNLRVLNSTFDDLTLDAVTNKSVSSGGISLFRSFVTDQLSIVSSGFYQNIGVFASEVNKIKFSGNEAVITGLANNVVLNKIEFLDENAEEVLIRKNTFSSQDSLRYTFDFDCDKLTFLDNTVEVPVLFADSKIYTRLEMANNSFTKPVDFHVVSFPEFGKYIPFSQFHSGFVVYKNLYGEDSPDGANCYYCEVYTGQTDEELADKTNYDKLVQSYEILFLGYKATGDIESANASYIRIKDLYLNRLGYIYRTEGGFKTYFRWQLAKLLKFYTNHGTDPALSIVISIYVVLIFAVFYIFYPSEWDVSSKARLIADFKDFTTKNDKGHMKPLLSFLVGFGISVINAITLSLNSFVTLGFGTIPTTGAARYVCIIEGFIGWFLLSIFTVSLINQILF